MKQPLVKSNCSLSFASAQNHVHEQGEQCQFCLRTGFKSSGGLVQHQKTSQKCCKLRQDLQAKLQKKIMLMQNDNAANIPTKRGKRMPNAHILRNEIAGKKKQFFEKGIRLESHSIELSKRIPNGGSRMMMMLLTCTTMIQMNSYWRIHR